MIPMKNVSRKLSMAALAVTLPFLLATSCGSNIVPFSGTVPAAALLLDGTYLITVTSGDNSQLGDNPTLVIAGGLLTKVGTTDMTPTNITNNGNNFIWMSAAVLTYPNSPFGIVTNVTLNADLQLNGTLVGTMVFAAEGIGTSQPLGVTLTKQ
jgi:hypothetical protein